MMKKCLAVLLSVLICMSALALAPLTASAQDADLAEAAADVEVVEEAADVEAVEEGAEATVAAEGAELDAAEEGAEATVAAEGAELEAAAEGAEATLAEEGAEATVAAEAAQADAADTGVLATPWITGFSSLDGGTKITWNAVAGAAKYRVYYKSSKGWTRIGDTTNNWFLDTGVSSGTTRTYTVRCINAAATAFTSGYDTSGKAYTYNMSTPRVTGLYSLSSGVKVAWNSVTNAKRYNVYYKSGGSWSKIGSVTGTSFVHSGAVFGRTYTYTVRCVNSAGSKFTSSFNNSGWSRRHYLNTPTVSGFEDLSGGVKIKIGTTGADRYAVYVKKSGKWSRIGTTTSNYFIDSSAAFGGNYTYTVRCLNAAGNTFTSYYNDSGWSHLHYLATPWISGFEDASNGVKIKLGTVTGAERYRIYVKKNGSWSNIGTTSNNYFVDTSAVKGYTYTYTVRCLNAAQNTFTSRYNGSGWSYTYNLLSTPHICESQVVSSGIWLRWNSVSGAAKYRVFYKTSPGDSWHTILDTTSLSFTHTGLVYGRTYIYTVRCLSANGSRYTSDFDRGGWTAQYKATPVVKNVYSNNSDKVYVDISCTHDSKVSYYKAWYWSGSEWKYIGSTKNGWIYYPSNMVTKDWTYSFTVEGFDSSGSSVTLTYLGGYRKTVLAA